MLLLHRKHADLVQKSSLVYLTLDSSFFLRAGFSHQKVAFPWTLRKKWYLIFIEPMNWQIVTVSSKEFHIREGRTITQKETLLHHQKLEEVSMPYRDGAWNRPKMSKVTSDSGFTTVL